jgi:DNA-binding SARP family transcriptional activator
MSVLQIWLFGNVQLTHEAWSAEVKVTHTVQGLLAYLLLQRHRCHPREILTNLFWGDYTEERARSCLSTTLWRLRRVLEPDGTPQGTYLVTTSTGEIGFNAESDYWLDVAVFEEQASRVLGKAFPAIETSEVQALAHTLQLYRGELLEGFYDDWTLRERERLRLLYLNSLAYLMRYYRHYQAYEEGLICGQQILNHDPLREEIHRDMMRLYLESGQRTLAVRQYETCREVLAAELGIPPMEETQALYAQIVPAASPDPVPSNFPREPANLKQALRQLRLSMQGFDEARERLQRAIQLVERLSERQD